MNLFEYAEKYNFSFRDRFLRVLYFKHSIDFQHASVDDVLKIDPDEFLEESGIGITTVYNLAKLFSKEYSLPKKWQGYLDDFSLKVKESHKIGITDKITEGAYIYVCQISDNIFTSNKVKVKEVHNENNNPNERYIILEKEILLGKKKTSRINGFDFETYKRLNKNGFGVFRNMTEIKKVFTDWM